MTLLITVFAAVIATAYWYSHAPEGRMKTGILCWLYWGAAIMWFVDAIFEYAELGADYFAPSAADMLNDTFLGLSVVALGLVIWVAALMISDPKGVVKGLLFKEASDAKKEKVSE